MGRHSLMEDPEPDLDPRTSTGSHRAITSTGTHRAIGPEAKRRRIAKWPIACLVLVLFVVLGVVGWNWAEGLVANRAQAQAAGCDSGNATLRVLVAPSALEPVQIAADRWNGANTVVRAHCVHVQVQTAPSQRVLDALSGKAQLSTIGGLPAAWIPESSYWSGLISNTKPELVGSPAQSVASARSADYPFLGLAGTGIDDVQLRAAQTFRDFLVQPAQQADFAAAGLHS